jgi:hypothetical protein
MDNDLDTALNTYMLIVLEMDADEIFYQKGFNGMSFFIDPYDYLYSDSGVIDVLNYCIGVFIEHEHYEKCSDIKEKIEEIGYEV